MRTKACFKCKKVQPLSEFYAHPRMLDGHLGKCKSCTRLDSAIQYAKKQLDPIWVEIEAERCRKKAALGRLVAHTRPTKEENKKRNRKWIRLHPDKYYAHRVAGNAMRYGKLIKQPCEKCGCLEVQAHHEDYSKPLDVRWLCVKHHNERHVEINAARRAQRIVEQKEKLQMRISNLESMKRRNAILAEVARGLRCKEIAGQVNATESVVAGIVKRAGYAPLYVTNDERKRIIEMRGIAA